MDYLIIAMVVSLLIFMYNIMKNDNVVVKEEDKKPTMGRPTIDFECVDCGATNVDEFYSYRKCRCIECEKIIKKERNDRNRGKKSREQHAREINEYMIKRYANG